MLPVPTHAPLKKYWSITMMRVEGSLSSSSCSRKYWNSFT